MITSTFGIEKIETYIPPQCLSSEYLSKQFGFDLDFIENKIGVKQLFVVDGETTSDIAVQAMNKLLKIYPFLGSQLDVLVVCTQTPDYQLPQVSAIVQSRCKLHRKLIAFDVSLGCSGFVYGLNIVESLLARNRLEKGVLITAETYSKIIDPTDRNTKCLFSDAATATLITRSGNVRLGTFCFGCDGDYYEHLIAKPSAAGTGPARLFMNGRGIFEFAVSTIPSEVYSTCKANDVDLEDIDFFIFHQASKYLLNIIANKMQIKDTTRVVNIMHLYGNTVSSSIPIALKEILPGHRSYGLKILISGFGVGLSWATNILTIEGDCSHV